MNARLPILLIVSLLALLPPVAGAQLRLPAPVADPLRIGPVAPAPAPAAPTGPKLVDRVVAIVNNEAITERQLALRTRLVGQRLRGQGVSLPPPDELQRQLLERMILDRVQLQAAREQGVRIDEASVDRAIQSIAGEARLSVAEYRKRIEAEGLPFSMLREEIATEIAVSRLRERDFDARTLVSEAEIDAAIAEQAAAGAAGGREFNIAQILVRVPEDAGPEVVERAAERAEQIAREARAGADLAALAARFSDGTDAVGGGVMGLRPADRLPSLFVEAVGSLSIGDVAPVVRSAAGFHVLKLLERRAGGITQLAGAPVRQTRARHILVRVNELNPEAEVVRRLTEIRQRIEAGAVAFADMARQYSVDGSAGQGGDLGWVYPGDTVPEFEREMDALAPGAIAGPVRSPFGYHLIQVVERRTDEASPDRIRAAIRNELRQRKAAEAYQEWVAQTRDRAYVEYRLDDR